MRVVLVVGAGVALVVFLAVAYVLPGMSGAGAKEAARALLAGAETAKSQVAAAAQKSGSLAGSGEGVKIASRNDPGAGDLKWVVEANGVIRGWNEKNAIEIALVPTLQGGRVSWSCRGFPISAMPSACGGRD
jgi:hypothetical protein